MRVVHIITRLIVGGAQENTISTVLGLDAIAGTEVHLISGLSLGPEGSLAHKVDCLSNRFIKIPELVRSISPWKDFRTLNLLTGILKKLSPDIVHTHSAKAGFLGRLAAAKAGIPLIVHSIHGPSFGSFQNQFSNFLFCKAERLAGKKTQCFISVADAMSRQYLEAGIGKPSQYHRVFSGFDLEPFLQSENSPALRSHYGIRETDFVIGKIARLFKLKGHDDLIDIARDLVESCPNIRFLLVGDGIWRARLESKIESLGLQDHFIFTGLVPPTEIPGLTGIMDMLVHLSTREGLPRALPQALAAGKPVVAYDCDGAKEVCVDNETGYLIEAGNLKTLTRRIRELWESKTLRDRLAAKGREFVLNNFDTPLMVKNIHAIYSDLLR